MSGAAISRVGPILAKTAGCLLDRLKSGPEPLRPPGHFTIDTRPVAVSAGDSTRTR